MFSINLTAKRTCAIDPCIIPYVYSVWCNISFRLLKGSLTSLMVSEETRLAVYDAYRTTHASIHVPATSLLVTNLAGWIVPAEKAIATRIIGIKSREQAFLGFLLSQGLSGVKSPPSKIDWKKQECRIDKFSFISGVKNQLSVLWPSPLALFV